MPAAAIYTRISRDDADDRLGVDRQEQLCRDLAEREHLDVVMVLVDNDVSAFTQSTKRPAFEELVEELKAGTVDTVVTYHADRLYRRTTDLERLVTIVEATGAQVRTVAAGDIDLTTASGRMIARMLGAAAQGESERMSERLKAKNDQLAAAGEIPGGRAPFGYAKATAQIECDGKLVERKTYVIDEREAAVVRLIAESVLEGSSLRSIVRDLDALGHRTRAGGSWSGTTVRAAVINPVIAGLRVHRREIAGLGKWEPILDRPTWERVRAVLTDPARKRRRPAQRYLLTGMVESPAGDTMIGRPDRGSDGRTDRRTYATRSPATQSLAVDADDLEATVAEMVLTALDGSTFPAAPLDTTAGEHAAQLEAELEELAAARGNGVISMAEWLAARAPLQERLESARASAQPKRSASLDAVLSQPGAARTAWPQLDFAQRRSIIAAVVERIVVGPATRARWTTIAERLDPDQGFGVVWRA